MALLLHHPQPQGRHVRVDVNRLHPGLAHHGHLGEVLPDLVVQEEVVPGLHLLQDGHLPVGVDHAVFRPVPSEDFLQAFKHPLVAPGVGGEESHGHRIHRHLVQEVVNIPGGVCLQPDLLLAFPEFGDRVLVEFLEVVQVVGPVALFEEVVRLLVFQDLEEHHDGRGLGLLVGQVGFQPGELFFLHFQAEGLIGQVGPQGRGIERDIVPPHPGLGQRTGK